METIITKDIYKKCLYFGKDVEKTNHKTYSERNSSNSDPMITVQNIAIGKMGEEAASEILSKKYNNLSKPDYKIYNSNRKSWIADLIDTSIPIEFSVKSQDILTSDKFGMSWTFQRSDKSVFPNSNKNHYAVFVLIELFKKGSTFEEGNSTIKGIVSIDWLHNKNLFEQMKKIDLRDNKVAVYYSSLLKYKDQLWQI